MHDNRVEDLEAEVNGLKLDKKKAEVALAEVKRDHDQDTVYWGRQIADLQAKLAVVEKARDPSLFWRPETYQDLVKKQGDTIREQKTRIASLEAEVTEWRQKRNVWEERTTKAEAEVRRLAEAIKQRVMHINDKGELVNNPSWTDEEMGLTEPSIAGKDVVGQEMPEIVTCPSCGHSASRNHNIANEYVCNFHYCTNRVFKMPSGDGKGVVGETPDKGVKSDAATNSSSTPETPEGEFTCDECTKHMDCIAVQIDFGFGSTHDEKRFIFCSDECFTKWVHKMFFFAHNLSGVW